MISHPLHNGIAYDNQKNPSFEQVMDERKSDFIETDFQYRF